MLLIRASCFFFTAFFLTAVATGPLLADASPLIWKFQVDEEYQYRMTQEMNMELALGATDRMVETSTRQAIDLTWKVQQVGEQGQAQLMQSVDRIQMDLQAPGQQKMHYDTASEETPTGFAAMLVPLFQAMTKQPFAMTMGPRGEIFELEVPENVAEALKTIPGAKKMGSLFASDGFKQMLQQTSLVLPDSENLILGQEWSTVSVVENEELGEIKTVTTYEYLGPREVRGEAYEAFAISMAITFGQAPYGMLVESKVKKSAGEILFSREKGRLESSHLHQDMELQFATGGQTMTQHMSHTVTLEYVEPQDTPATEPTEE